jgi:nitroreductase
MTRLAQDTTLSPDQLLARLRWRYATKRFEPGPAGRLAPEQWAALEQALVLAPSSFGLQPWHFVVVTEHATKLRLQELSFRQPQAAECSHLVVFAHRKGLAAEDVRRYVERVAAVRGATLESLAGFEGVMARHVAQPPPFDVDEWTRRQTYIALGMLLASAAVLGVDACPMEGIDRAGYDAALGLAARGYASVCAAALGRRAEGDKYAALPKVRFEPRDVITHVR